MTDLVQGVYPGEVCREHPGKVKHPVQGHPRVLTGCSTLTGYPQGIAECPRVYTYTRGHSATLARCWLSHCW